MLRGLVTHHEIILVDDGAPEATVARVRTLLERSRLSSLPPAVAPLRRGDGDHRRARRGDRRLRHRHAAEHGSAVAHSRIPRAGARRRGHRVRRATPSKERAILVSHRRARLLLVHQRRGPSSAFREDSTQFRCMSRQVVNAITQIRGPDQYLRMLTSYIGFRKQAHSRTRRSTAPARRPSARRVTPSHLARALVMDSHDASAAPGGVGGSRYWRC